MLWDDHCLPCVCGLVWVCFESKVLGITRKCRALTAWEKKLCGSWCCKTSELMLVYMVCVMGKKDPSQWQGNSKGVPCTDTMSYWPGVSVLQYGNESVFMIDDTSQTVWPTLIQTLVFAQLICQLCNFLLEDSFPKVLKVAVVITH